MELSTALPGDEPFDVYPEAKFEAALKLVVGECLEPDGSVAIIPRFGTDIAVFTLYRGVPRAVFIEAKSYGAQRPGGVGFGNGRGEGPQVDILLRDPNQLGVLDEFVRWAFVDATRSVGSARYALLKCAEAKASVMSRVAQGKQNNFRWLAITQHLVVWPQFRNQLTTFLRDNRDPAE